MKADAPWTDEQIAALRTWQDNPTIHPYTCGTDSRHRPLVPTRDGWCCLDCDYTQNWAHIPPASENEAAHLERELGELAAHYTDLFCGAASKAYGLDHAMIAHALFLLIEEATRRREQWIADCAVR